MDLQHLRVTIDTLQGVLSSMQLLSQSELVRDLESSEGFQDSTSQKLAVIQSDLNEYIQSLKQVKEDIENPQDDFEFKNALADVFGASFF